jgi:hypothetical protein
MILFKNATISSGITKERKVDILFDDKIIEVREDSIIAPENAQVIDLDGKIVLPGCIDIHTHFKSNNPEWSSHFYNATKAAVSGGITLLADSSCNTDEPLTESFNFDDVVDSYSGNALCDYSVWGWISSDDYSDYNEEIQELSKAGVVGIEFYLYNKGFTPSPLDFEEILELFTDFSNSQILFGVFPMGFLPDNATADNIEDIQFDMIKKLFRRSQESEIHLFNIVSPTIVDFIMNSTKKYHCSYDLNPYVFLKNNRAEFIPNVQAEVKTQTFLNLIQTGKIPSLSTNSGYINNDLNYTSNDYTDIVNSVDLQHIIPFIISELYLTKKMPLGNLERMLAGNPSKILGIEHKKGNFNKDSDADFIVIDPRSKSEVTDEQSSFYGKDINCKVDMTFIRGTKIYDSVEGIQDNRQFGKLVKRNFQATTLNYY